MKTLSTLFVLLLLSNLCFGEEKNRVRMEYNKAAETNSKSNLLVRTAAAVKFKAKRDLIVGQIEMEVMKEPGCHTNNCLTYTYIMDNSSVCLVKISNVHEEDDEASCFDRIK